MLCSQISFIKRLVSFTLRMDLTRSLTNSAPLLLLPLLGLPPLRLESCEESDTSSTSFSPFHMTRKKASVSLSECSSSCSFLLEE